MQLKIIKLTDVKPEFEDMPATAISFNPFLNALRKRISEENSVKKEFFEYVLNKFLANPHLKDVIELENLVHFKDEMQLLYSVLEKPIADDKTTLWALSEPLAPHIFFGTDGFYDFILGTNEKPFENCEIKQETLEEDKYAFKKRLLYNLLYGKLYQECCNPSFEIINSILFKEEGRSKYFKVTVDTTYVDVLIDEELPYMDEKPGLAGSNDPDEYIISELEKLPLSKFTLKGFGVITVTDVTTEQALDNLTNLTLNRKNYRDQDFTESIVESLQSLVGSSDIGFGLIPNLRVNDKLVFNSEGLRSFIVNKDASDGEDPQLLLTAEKYLNNPQIYLIDVQSVQANQDDIIIKTLKKEGLANYALYPIYYRDKLAGVLEMYCAVPGLLNWQTFNLIQPAIPIIAQLAENIKDEFNSSIDSIIKDRFTTLQPAVQWKFNDVAWHYLRDHDSTIQGNNFTEKIQFKNVYPLYGAIDIRNSTVERNKALAEDSKVQLSFLINVLQEVREKTDVLLIDEKIFRCREWLHQIEDQLGDNDYAALSNYLREDIQPLLEHLYTHNLGLHGIIKDYLEETMEENGLFYKNRNILENSLQKVNKAITRHLDIFNKELQEVYPCYFEKFRSDGVEYDIYIGQSITPDKPFDNFYLKNIRLRQLKSMAELAKITHNLLQYMEKPLYTTQLIFVNATPLNIVFRADERKFDVEGEYNIRYQIIKKRIDKVHVKDSAERLTQPGTISIVYYSNPEFEEYHGYLQYLQNQGILQNNIEMLDLEELQGVTGLRAMRVGVVLEEVASKLSQQN